MEFLKYLTSDYHYNDNSRLGRENARRWFLRLNRTWSYTSNTPLTLVSVEVDATGPCILGVGLSILTKTSYGLRKRENHHIIVKSNRDLETATDPFAFGSCIETVVDDEQNVQAVLDDLLEGFGSKGHNVWLTSLTYWETFTKLRISCNWSFLRWPVFDIHDILRAEAMEWCLQTYHMSLEELGLKADTVSLENIANTAWVSLELLERLARQASDMVLISKKGSTESISDDSNDGNSAQSKILVNKNGTTIKRRESSGVDDNSYRKYTVLGEDGRHGPTAEKRRERQIQQLTVHLTEEVNRRVSRRTKEAMELLRKDADIKSIEVQQDITKRGDEMMLEGIDIILGPVYQSFVATLQSEEMVSDWAINRIELTREKIQRWRDTEAARERRNTWQWHKKGLLQIKDKIDDWTKEEWRKIRKEVNKEVLSGTMKGEPLEVVMQWVQLE